MPESRHSSGVLWAAWGGIILLTFAAAVVPIVECHECDPYYRPLLDESGRVMPGRPTGAIPQRCPMCKGVGRVSVIRRWTHPREGWYPVFFVETIRDSSGGRP